MAKGETLEDPVLGPLRWKMFEGWKADADAGPFGEWGAAVPVDGPLRKKKRIELTLPGSAEEPPSEAARATFAAFLNDPDVADRVLAYLLPIYQRQRPGRLKWWAAYYDDAPDTHLPEANKPADLRPLFWLSEVTLEGENMLRLQIDAAFDYRGLAVLLVDNQPVRAGPTPTPGWGFKPLPEPTDHPLFGPLRPGDFGLEGSYATRLLHGDSSAGSIRLTGEKYPQTLELREAPSWSVVEGVYSLGISVPHKTLEIDPGQIVIYEEFMADQLANEALVLKAIADHFREIRDDYVEGWDEREAQLKMPPVVKDENVLHSVTFGGVTIPRAEVWDVPGLAFTFYWDNEHPLGVTWRNGEILYTGDDETAVEEAAGPSKPRELIHPATGEPLEPQ